MKRLIILVGIFICLGTARSQELQGINEKTDISPDARFELIQSSLAARFTFKLDRFTGDVYQLAMSTDSVCTWVSMYKQPHKRDTERPKGFVNYQIFTSGMAARFTFLMNVRTGCTWQLMNSAEGENIWVPLNN